MTVTDKLVNFRVKPYIQEASLQFIIDTIVIIFVTVVFVIADFPVIACVFVDLIYMIAVGILHYRVLVQAIIDKNKGDYVTDIISIKQIKEEYSFAGDRLGHSNIHLFYPKEIQVGKYKLCAINNKVSKY